MRSWIGSDLPPIHRDGKEYFILSYRGGLYLVANKCPHRGGPLKWGKLVNEDEIVCPHHAGRFSLGDLIAQKSSICLLAPET